MNHSMPGLPYPSPTPGVHSNSCPLSRWCHPAISSSVIPFFCCPHPSQHQGLLQWVNCSHEVAKVLEFQLQHQSFQWIYSGLISFRMDWLDLLAVQGTLNSLLQHHSSKASIFWQSAFFHTYMTTGKTIALTRRTFVGKVMSLLFNMLSAAAAAKSLQLCLTLCDPMDGSPPGSPVPGILQARTLEWVAISFSNAWKWKVKVKSLSRVRLLATPWAAAYQAFPSMAFSRQEYWSGLPLPSPICFLGWS